MTEQPPNGLSAPAVRAFAVLLLLMFPSCSSYYHNNWNFNQEFEKGELANALETLQRNPKEAEGRNRFIFYANKGILNSILGRYDESNEAFETAFLFGEDYRINYFAEAVSYLSNPTFTTYRGEDHEHLMVLYFKAINFLKMGRHDDALVECRRLNIRLNQLNDRYASEEKLQRDAFIHTLMGIIYQSARDYNNAFIAYRNAVQVYEDEYTSLFRIGPPQQLKKDLLYAAWKTGLTEEYEHFKAHFGMPDYAPAEAEADLVFFWHNGLAPVKEEWGINFVIDRGEGNFFVFRNEGLGVAFPFEVREDKDRKDLSRLEVFRVAFPRYQERPLYYDRAWIGNGEQEYPLELGEDINGIAFMSLKQRMMKELSKGLLRAALKKAAEHSVRKEHEDLGAVLGLVNAITEKADTRSWQTLPHSIFYSRVPLKAGRNEISFNLQSPDAASYQFTYEAKAGQTLFHTFSSLDSKPVAYRYY